MYSFPYENTISYIFVSDGAYHQIVWMNTSDWFMHKYQNFEKFLINLPLRSKFLNA